MLQAVYSPSNNLYKNKYCISHIRRNPLFLEQIKETSILDNSILPPYLKF